MTGGTGIHVFPILGKYVTNLQNVTLVNNTAKTTDIVIPGGFRVAVVGGHIQNNDNVGRNCNVTARFSGGTQRCYLVDTVAIATTVRVYFPTADMADESISQYPVILDEAEIIRFSWLAGGDSAGWSSLLSVEWFALVKD